MSTDESSRLRAAVRAELHLEAIRRPETARREDRRRSWLTRALPSLAAAASLVVVIAVALNLTRDSYVSEETRVPREAETADQATSATLAPAPTAYAAQTTIISATAAPTTVGSIEGESFEAAADEAMLDEGPMDEVQMMEEPPEFGDVTDTTVSVTMVAAATATTALEEELSASAGFAFDFSTDQPGQALRFTSAAFILGDENPFPVSQLPEKAARAGLVCWENAADAADPEDEVFFMAHGLIDGVEGEAYRIEEEAADAQERDSEEDDVGVIHLFAYPDCRRVDFAAP